MKAYNAFAIMVLLFVTSCTKPDTLFHGEKMVIISKAVNRTGLTHTYIYTVEAPTRLPRGSWTLYSFKDYDVGDTMVIDFVTPIEE